MEVITIFSGIGKFALSLFASLFENNIDRSLQNKVIENNFNLLDNSIIKEISDKVSDAGKYVESINHGLLLQNTKEVFFNSYVWRLK